MELGNAFLQWETKSTRLGKSTRKSTRLLTRKIYKTYEEGMLASHLKLYCDGYLNVPVLAKRLRDFSLVEFGSQV